MMSRCWFASQASLQAIESAFWNVVERADEPVEVLYGADIDTTITGSGFPQEVHDIPQQL